MKRMIAFLLALMMPVCAGAETVSQQVDAPAQVTDTFISKTGKTVITLNAKVSVPDAEAMYLIPVAPTAFSDELVPVLAEALWPGLGSSPMEIDEGNQTVSVNGVAERGYFKHAAYIEKIGTKQEDINVTAGNYYSMLPHIDGKYNASLQGAVRFDNRYRLKGTVNYDSPFMDVPLEGDRIDGHPLSSAQAAQIAQNLLSLLTNEDFALFEAGQSRGRVYDDQRIADETAQEGTGFSYALLFTRVLDGVTILPCHSQFMDISSARDDLYAPPVGYEQVAVAINREGQITNFHWSSPYAIAGEGMPQTLLPFDSILSIARQTMPLKYQGGEVYGDIGLHVYRIDLGYMAVLQRDSLAFALTPVWNFYGYDVPEDVHMSIRPLLTVNAVDGTVIDLDYGY